LREIGRKFVDPGSSRRSPSNADEPIAHRTAVRVRRGEVQPAIWGAHNITDSSETSIHEALGRNHMAGRMLVESSVLKVLSVEGRNEEISPESWNRVTSVERDI
jgi:hypothetical protein